MSRKQKIKDCTYCGEQPRIIEVFCDKDNVKKISYQTNLLKVDIGTKFYQLFCEDCGIYAKVGFTLFEAIDNWTWKARGIINKLKK